MTTREDRIEELLEALRRETHALAVQVAGLSERFPTRAELLELSADAARRSRDITLVREDVAGLKTDTRRIWAALSAVGAAALSAVGGVLTQLFGGG